MSLSTGDLVFFYGDTHWKIDKLIMDVTDSPYSHVGVIVKDPPWDTHLKGTFLLQSSSNDNDAAEQKDRCLHHCISGNRLHFDIKQRQLLVPLQVLCQPYGNFFRNLASYDAPAFLPC